MTNTGKSVPVCVAQRCQYMCWSDFVRLVYKNRLYFSLLSPILVLVLLLLSVANTTPAVTEKYLLNAPGVFKIGMMIIRAATRSFR
jgi:hypothetical protein